MGHYYDYTVNATYKNGVDIEPIQGCLKTWSWMEALPAAMALLPSRAWYFSRIVVRFQGESDMPSWEIALRPIDGGGFLSDPALE